MIPAVEESAMSDTLSCEGETLSRYYCVCHTICPEELPVQTLYRQAPYDKEDEHFLLQALGPSQLGSPPSFVLCVFMTL